MQNVNIKPLGNRLIVEQEDEHETSNGGVILTSDVRSFRYGTVVETGPDCKYYEKGDRIIYVKEACEEIIVDEGLPNEIKFSILYREDDVYAKIT